MTRLLPPKNRSRGAHAELDGYVIISEPTFGQFDPKSLYTAARESTSCLFESANLSREVRAEVREATDRQESAPTVIPIEAAEPDQYLSLFFELWRDSQARSTLKEVIETLAHRPQPKDRASDILEQAIRLSVLNQSDLALDIIYDRFDEMLLAGKFSELDAFLGTASIDTLPTVLILAVLTVTLPAKRQLKSRPEFFERARVALVERLEFRDELLIGLE